MLAAVAAARPGALALGAASLPTRRPSPPPKTLRVVAHATTSRCSTRPFSTRLHRAQLRLHGLRHAVRAGQRAASRSRRWSSGTPPRKDSKPWSFTLRPSLKFSDGSAVTSADVVATLQRWAARDSMGRCDGRRAGAEWKVVDDKHLLAARWPSPSAWCQVRWLIPRGFKPLFILPEKHRQDAVHRAPTEVHRLGPVHLQARRMDAGQPRWCSCATPTTCRAASRPSGTAGGKKSSFDRVEWRYMPDANTATAALKSGEVDIVNVVPPDYIAPLRTDANVKIGAGGA